MEFNWNKSVRGLPENPGIYGIKCEANGRIYIGSTIKLRSRCRDHISRLRSGSHRNRFLQSAWVEFGESVFVFAALEICLDGNGLTEKELGYIERFNTAYSSGGFNLELMPRKGGYDITTRMLLSQKMLGPSHPHRGKKFPKAYCDKVSRRVRSQGPMSGVLKGVNLDARTKTYMARIYVAGKQLFLGRYKTELEAAQAYNGAAVRYFGSGCFLNPVPEGEPIRCVVRGRPVLEASA